MSLIVIEIRICIRIRMDLIHKIQIRRKQILADSVIFISLSSSSVVYVVVRVVKVKTKAYSN